MAKPIEISLVANTRGFIAGTQDASRALDGVSDSLDDVARDARRAGQQAEDGLAGNLRDGVRDGERSLERLEGEFRQLATRAKDAGDDAGDGIGHGMERAKEGVRSFKEEAIQNFSETASSFDGTAQGIADGVQGTFGGLASALPLPFGIAAGTIGAILGAVLQQSADDAEAQKQRVQDAFDDMIENQSRYVSQAYIGDRLKEILDDPGLTAAAQTTAKAIGLPYDAVVASIAGVPGAQESVNAAISANYDRLFKKSQDINAKTAAQGDAQVEAIDKVRSATEKQAGAVDTAAGKYGVYSRVLDGIKTDSDNAASGIDGITSAFARVPARKDVTVAANTDDANARVENTAGRLRSLPDGKVISVQVRDDGGLADIERRVKRLSNGVTIPVGTSAGRFGRGEL